MSILLNGRKMEHGKRFTIACEIRYGSKRGKKREPTLGIIDSQTVKTTHHRLTCGYDAGKKIKGRKRHILVDTLGLIHGLKVHPANDTEWAGAKLLLEPLKDTLTTLERVAADSGYRGPKLRQWVKEICGWGFEIIKRTELHVFKTLPKRWIVERTFGWFENYRRLSKDYEYKEDTEENMIYISMTQLMLKRLAL
jgi:putative transposase